MSSNKIIHNVFRVIPSNSVPFWLFVPIIVLLGAMVATIGITSHSAFFGAAYVAEDTVFLSGGMYSKRISREALLSQEADIVALGRSTRLRRTNGVEYNGYNAGWYDFSDGRKALVFLTKRGEVVRIPTTEGYEVLISVQNPRTFITALQSNSIPIAEGQGSRAEKFPFVPAGIDFFWIPGIVGGILLAVIMYLMSVLYYAKHATVRIFDDKIRLNGGLYRKTISLNDVRLDEVDTLNLNKNRNYLGKRTTGIDLLGFVVGYFNVKDDGKAFAFLTEQKNVVRIPTSMGYEVLLSLEESQAFIDSIRKDV